MIIMFMEFILPLDIVFAFGTESSLYWFNSRCWLCMIVNYSDVIMNAIESQIAGVSILCSTVCSDQRKYQSSASLAFVREIHPWPVDSHHKGPVTRNMFLFDDVIMWASHMITHSVYPTNIRFPKIGYHRGMPNWGLLVTEIRELLSNHTLCILWDVINHPCPNLADDLT